MSAIIPTNCYSADAILSLAMGNLSIRLAQVALPACEADVVVKVEGHEHRRRVYIPTGTHTGKGRVRIEVRTAR